MGLRRSRFTSIPQAVGHQRHLYLKRQRNTCAVYSTVKDLYAVVTLRMSFDRFFALFQLPYCRVLPRIVTLSTETRLPSAFRCATTFRDQIWSRTKVGDVSIFKTKHGTNVFARQSIHSVRHQLLRPIMLLWIYYSVSGGARHEQWRLAAVSLPDGWH